MGNVLRSAGWRYGSWGTEPVCRQGDLSSASGTHPLVFKSSGVMCTWNPRDGEVETGRFLGLTDWLVLPRW